VEEHLPSQHEALRSSPNTTKRKRKTKEEENSKNHNEEIPGRRQT
jgi:hypothetical protein